MKRLLRFLCTLLAIWGAVALIAAFGIGMIQLMHRFGPYPVLGSFVLLFTCAWAWAASTPSAK